MIKCYVAYLEGRFDLTSVRLNRLIYNIGRPNPYKKLVTNYIIVHMFLFQESSVFDAPIIFNIRGHYWTKRLIPSAISEPNFFKLMMKLKFLYLSSFKKFYWLYCIGGLFTNLALVLCYSFYCFMKFDYNINLIFQYFFLQINNYV